MQYDYFGVLLDMSRNAVMKVSELKNFIDVLAKLGYNAIELYTEDTYEVPSEPYFGYLRGRYTQNEIREIDLYAKQKGIELIPCIQTLAHFNGPRKNFALRELFDTADILLCGEDRTYEFIENLKQLDQLINVDFADRSTIRKLAKSLDKKYSTMGFYQALCFEVIDKDGTYYKNFKAYSK